MFFPPFYCCGAEDCYVDFTFYVEQEASQMVDQSKHFVEQQAMQMAKQRKHFEEQQAS